MKLYHKYVFRGKVAWVSVDIGWMNNPTSRTEGISNRTQDGMFVLFLDYDYIFKEVLELELLGLQKRFELSDIHILATNEREENGATVGSYHAICLDKFPVQELVEIVKYPTCDWNFKRGAYRDASHSWILRYGPKGERDAPVYLESIRSPFFRREQSEAHSIFYEEEFGVKINLKNPDGITDWLMGESYLTANRLTEDDA